MAVLLKAEWERPQARGSYWALAIRAPCAGCPLNSAGAIDGTIEQPLNVTELPNTRFEGDAAKNAAPLKRNVRRQKEGAI
jgi:hypothetical protein